VSGTTDISIVDSTASGFSPGTAPVLTGATVKWTNNDGVQHTVTSTTVPANGAFNATLNPGTTVCLNFSAAGAFNYQCSIHLVMQGLVTVQ
jgi:plastocyanin